MKHCMRVCRPIGETRGRFSRRVVISKTGRMRELTGEHGPGDLTLEEDLD
jgi:hypothetical protein